MEITVRLFAALREHAGTRELTLDLQEGSTVADAIVVLRAGALAGLPERAPFVTALDREYVEDDERLHAGSELALVPPVSGGTTTDDAVRKVALTSTMRAAPSASRWVSRWSVTCVVGS